MVAVVIRQHREERGLLVHEASARPVIRSAIGQPHGGKQSQRRSGDDVQKKLPQFLQPIYKSEATARFALAVTTDRLSGLN